MAKQLIIQVRKNGTIDAETFGMHGQECLDYIDILEDMLEADVVSSSYTAEYATASTPSTTSDSIDVGTGQ